VTVANIWANRKSLAGKMVTVRGKVMKFNGGIMGLNWVHLQDGTGSSRDGTHDITVTSNADARVGDIVTVTGTVAIDKDLGAGYNYPVIIQGATITVK
jgi:RecJ-like exonuclease